MAAPSESTRVPAPPISASERRPVVLAIGGSDSSAGAGIQADLKAVAANGGYARTAVTAVTAQHSGGVSASYAVPAEVVAAQIDAAFRDGPPVAVKTGMLATGATADVVARALEALAPRAYVLDPVIRSSSGAALIDDEGVEVLLRQLLPLAALVTPNAPEAEALTGIAVRSRGDAERAGRALLELGARAVLVKGGHLERDAACDVLVTRTGVRAFEAEFQPGREVHGTGCAYASAIATWLARGYALEQAIEEAKMYLSALIASAVRVGPGALIADHFAARGANG